MKLFVELCAAIVHCYDAARKLLLLDMAACYSCSFAILLIFLINSSKQALSVKGFIMVIRK